jgi:heptosyltransferase-2
LRGQVFDAALVLPNSPRSALEIWLARIPHRIGYARRWRNWLLTLPLQTPAAAIQPRRRGVREIKRLIQHSGPQTSHGGPAYRHQIHDYLYLAAALGADPSPLSPKLELSGEEIQAAVAACLPDIQPETSPNTDPALVLLGLNPSAAYGPAKCWPLERFAGVMRQVSKAIPNAVWLIFGTETDWQICEGLVKAGSSRVVNLTGKTSLRQLMALLKRCALLLTNDSGPMHVAAALGTPVVVPFGSTSPELTGPFQPGTPCHHLLRQPVACAPCFRRTCPIDFRCMLGISVETVVSAVLAVLKTSVT